MSHDWIPDFALCIRLDGSDCCWFGCCNCSFKGAAAVDPYGLDSFDYDAFQDMDGAAVEVIE